MAKRQLHKLSAREAESIVKSGRHGDGGGLYLVIEAGAHWRRQWIFLYRTRGTKGKGKDGLSLTDARLKAADARKKLAEGHRGPSGARSMHKPAGGR
jgi:Arm domain-containing DNA-binding protein